MQSNPIQQRIEMICEKWEEAKSEKSSRIVRIVCQPDEVDMVDTFYTYMIGVDTPILDIAFHFDSPCYDAKSFGTSLLKELEKIMQIWNNSEKDERIDYVPIKWKADYSLQRDRNCAAMFVENFNRLAKEMDLADGLFAVAIFKSPVLNQELITWFKNAIEANISPAVKYLAHDTVNHPFFRPLESFAPDAIATIPINLDMPKAMEQVAAMGDPQDPATYYRQVFMKMMNAMGAEKENDAEKFGKECIELATKNLSRDPYWITQIVVINTALGSDKIRYKKKKESLDYANKAVETATASKLYFENQISDALLAQTLMFRATVFFVQSDWNEACADYSVAFELYQKQGNMALAIEACRMAGKTALKQSLNSKASRILANGALLGKKLDTETAKGSTYAGVLELLLETNHTPFISMNEIDEIARDLYGEDWVNIIKSWKKVPDKNVLQQEELEVADS